MQIHQILLGRSPGSRSSGPTGARERTRTRRRLALESLEGRQLLAVAPVGYLIQGQAGTYQVPTNGNTFTAASVTQGTLPAGLTLSSTGLIAGTPAAGTQGTSSLTVQVTPTVGSAYNQDLTLTILANQFVDPSPSTGNGFGTTILVLGNGNVVVTAPYDDAGATDAGAVYLFNGATGALLSTLKGSSASDTIGSGGVTPLIGSSHYLIQSPNWHSGTLASVGAVTWGSGTAGVSGVLSSTNSLVGSRANDRVGNGGITTLNNGNYVVRSLNWANGGISDSGAVTWGSGTAGVSGAISSLNSLVGTSIYGDRVGSNGVTALTNGNYVVTSPYWDPGTGTRGAATWGSGTSGISGVISSTNSLVGATNWDNVGSEGVTALTNGNYVVRSANCYNGTVSYAGAVTWGSGATGVTGVVSSLNSLVGSLTKDYVGREGVTALSNGNYVVLSNNWHPGWDSSGSYKGTGAVTWGSGTAGVKGVVSSDNSLVGSTVNDQVGSDGITALSNGDYLVGSQLWDNGTAATNAGAITWGSGTAGVSGILSSANSLVGASRDDRVASSGAVVLPSGNYLVRSNNWDNGTATNAGAVTWGSGTSGVSGVVSSANSLVGSSVGDGVGSAADIIVLSNGNYVVRSKILPAPGAY